MKSEFGLIGLGVMGKNLSRNLARQGFSLSLFNRHVRDKEEKVAEGFIEEHPELSGCKGFDRIHEFVFSLAKPRKILLMIEAGEATTRQLEDLSTYLDSGDIVIDGGNTHFKDTQQRMDLLDTRGIRFIGAGISGGEEGALNGPSIMPGGDKEAYEEIKTYLEAIAAKDKDENACCTYIGPQGAGHFVKMVHNGIEYGEMQLLAEIYYLLRFGLNFTPDKIATLFSKWVDGALNSYLLEITVKILQKMENDDWLIDKILDSAGNKGTGSWTSIAAAGLGVPIPTINAALNARFLSFFKKERIQAAELYTSGKASEISVTPDQLNKAFQLSRVINHHQGFHLLQAASDEYDWHLNLPEIARIWTNGCILRSELIESLSSVLKDQSLILLHREVNKKHAQKITELGQVVAESIQHNFYIPCLSASLNYLNGFITANSSANIIQAQRDYFGAHTYKRIDDPERKSHHTKW